MTEPGQIRAKIEALLAELPGDPADPELAAQNDIEQNDIEQNDIDELARRLEEAHEMLVQALDSVEKG